MLIARFLSISKFANAVFFYYSVPYVTLTIVMRPSGILMTEIPMGRPAKELIVSAEERRQLESIARSQSLPAALARRAQMILRMAEGEPNSVVAAHLGVSRPTVTFWRTRFRERGIEGLHNELKPGRPRNTSDEQIAQLINTALQSRPKGATHWSVTVRESPFYRAAIVSRILRKTNEARMRTDGRSNRDSRVGAGRDAAAAKADRLANGQADAVSSALVLGGARTSTRCERAVDFAVLRAARLGAVDAAALECAASRTRCQAHGELAA